MRLDGGMTRRITQLIVGLALYGAGTAFVVRAGLGVDPWTALAEGIASRTGWGVGWVTNILGAAVLLLWIPLRQRPGIGTLANIALVGTSMQATLAVVSAPDSLLLQIGALILGILLVAVASGLYLGARWGAGPRDGLMTGIHTRWNVPIWAARGSVEGSVLVLGWMLGGTVGIGTVVFAATIGPLVHLTIPWFDTQRQRPVAPDAGATAEESASPQGDLGSGSTQAAAASS